MGLFCAYLSSSGILSPDPRISPPTFFTISLLVAAAALRPTFHTAIVAIAISIFAAVFLALDKIHGDCYYHVLWGKPDWGLFGRSDLEYYQQCVQGAQALWLMLVIRYVCSLPHGVDAFEPAARLTFVSAWHTTLSKSLCWGVAVLVSLHIPRYAPCLPAHRLTYTLLRHAYRGISSNCAAG